KSITDGPLRRVFAGSVEGEVVDHRSDDHTAAHELADSVADVFVVPAQAIDPAHHQDIALAELIEEPATLWPLDEASMQSRDAIVGHDLVYGEPSGPGMGKLVVDGLLRGADAGVEDGGHVDGSSVVGRWATLASERLSSVRLHVR